jgi:hypothetical protein
MFSRLARRISMTSTKFFLLLTGASAIFVYLVSPTREPDFGNLSNLDGGSPHWWLQGVTEGHWMLAAIILAALLAIKVTLNLWQLFGSQTNLTAHQHQDGIPLIHFVIDVMPYVIGVSMWWILSYVFFLYLLEQCLID